MIYSGTLDAIISGLDEGTTTQDTEGPHQLPTYEVGDWVAVNYDADFWPGEVESISDNGKCNIRFFKPVEGTTNKYIAKDERAAVAHEEILCKIPNAPEPVSSRHWALPLEDFVLTNTMMMDVLGIKP